MNVDLDLYVISGDFPFLCAGMGLDPESATIDYLQSSLHPSLYGDDLPYLDAWIVHALCTTGRHVTWCAPKRMHNNIRRRFDDLTAEIGRRRGSLMLRTTSIYTVVGMTLDIAITQQCNRELRNNIMARSKQFITII